MKKETLTMEKIKSDLKLVKKLRVAEVAVYIVGSVLIGIMVLLFLFSSMADELGNIRYSFGVYFLLLKLLLIGDFVNSLCLRAQCKRLAISGNFVIKKGALKEKTFWGRYNTTYIFKFCKFGAYEFSGSPETWENVYNGTVINGLYRTTEPGDLFYLVCNKRGKLLIAYPTKLFEFPEAEG